MSDEKKDVVVKEPNQINIQSALIEIIQRKDIDVDKLEKFIDLQIKMEERQSKRLFNEAMTSFQGDCPTIQKTGKVKFKNTQYSHGELDEIIHVIRPHLKKHGLSYSFNIKKHDNESELITNISQQSGHDKDFSYFFNTLDDGGVSMNSSQKRRSALTYAKRTALENALGIVCTDDDDDARRAIDESITESQIDEINQLVNKTDTKLDDLLHYLKIDDINELSVYEGRKTINTLRQKRSLNSEKKR